MENKHPPEKVTLLSSGDLDIVDVFPTIQGEGPFAGCPAVFVRLAGCTLQCPFCDTDYTTGRYVATVSELLKTIAVCEYQQWEPLIVLTGGEPLRQNVVPFVRAATDEGYHVQIETNGVCPIDMQLQHLCDYRAVTIVCSPKTSSVHATTNTYVRVWKYVVEEGKIAPDDGLPIASLGMKQRCARPPSNVRHHNIYIQPLDSGDKQRNLANCEAAVEVCRRFGYRLCLQQHKMLNLP